MLAKDSSSWELASPIEDFPSLVKDKSRAFAVMLPKETQSLEDQKNLFYVLATNFRTGLQQLSDLSIAEIADKVFRETSDAMINVHHSQGNVWNNFNKEVSQRY